MGDTLTVTNDIDELRKRLIADQNLWQNNLLPSQKFWKLAQDKGIRAHNHKTVLGLWHAGFIRADVIASRNKIDDILGLTFVFEDDGVYYYLDQRKLPHRENGYGSCIVAYEPDTDTEVLFHPYRLYPLYHVVRAFESGCVSTQYLTYAPGLESVAKYNLEHLDRWTSTLQFCERFDFWNQISEMAIVMEPASYHRVFHSIRWRYPDTEDSIIKKLDEYEEELDKIVSELDVTPFEKARKELCSSAEMIDPNKMLHVLLRLTSWHKKQSLKGDIGASMHFIAMAEIIRRSVERAHHIELPEEDELGFGQWFSGARKITYGAERVLDAPRTEVRDFMAELQLDYGVKVRCYVEGETEFGAIKHAIEGIGGIEVINLRGQVVEKKGKGVSFRDALKNDAASYVFSFVFLDGDVKDNLRAVKKAAEDDIMCGRFFLANPDFEMENFSYEELVEVAVMVAENANLMPPDTEKMLNKKDGVETANDFFRVLYDVAPDISRYCKKSEAWGEALMKYATENDKERPCTTAIRQILIAKDVKYSISRDKYKVDPKTGDLVER